MPNDRLDARWRQLVKLTEREFLSSEAPREQASWGCA